MTAAAAVHPRRDWDGLLQTWRDLDVPEGWRAEIDDGGITMTPPPSGSHNKIADNVHWTVRNACPPDVGVYQTLGVQFPLLGKLYVPDLCVCPAARIPDDDEVPVTGDAILLAVEITSKGNAEHDRKTKLWAYGHGPVPLYLLIDRYDPNGPTVTLYSEPSDGGYRRHLAVPFGEPVDLPAPFDVTLDTARFPTGS